MTADAGEAIFADSPARISRDTGAAAAIVARQMGARVRAGKSVNHAVALIRAGER